MLKMVLKLAVCSLILLIEATAFYGGRQTAAPAVPKDLASRHLSKVKIEAQGLESLFSELSLAYDIPIGLEVAAGDEELAPYTIELQSGTISDLLRQFVSRHTQYAWEVKDGVVNIFPKDGYRDAVIGELLGVKVGRLSVKEQTSSWAFEDSLITTPEVSRVLKARGLTPRGRNFTGTYFPQLGRHFTLDVGNVSLKSVLNRVVKESPTAKFWLIKKDNSGRTFLMRLSARHEDFPLSHGKPALFRL